MAELQIEVLIVFGLALLSFIGGHILRKFNIIVIPESVVTVILGMIVAVLWYFVPGHSQELSFNQETFFLVLLPFIIFESGYSVHRQSLFRNMGSILMFAIVGTFMCAFGVGIFLFLTIKAKGTFDFGFLDCMIVGAVMSSTDPVATLSIFSKLDMDRMTYSLVFGESVLNDAVSIVSFKTLVSFYSQAFTAATFFTAVGVFLGIFVGSLVIGIIMACAISLVLRRTDIGKHTPMEIVFVIGGSYVAYLIPDAAGLSGIVSIFFYGVATRHYTYYTLSEDSQKGAHWAFESLKECCETTVFCLLGVTILESHLQYNAFLIAMCCLACIISRAIQIGALSFLLNIRRPESDRISWKSQLVMWNSGLRGAVSYALAVSPTMPATSNSALMITTIHASVIFTILAHGLITAPLVRLTGLAGNSHRALSEPMPARKKIHGWWSGIDKKYIIPLISYPRKPASDILLQGNDDELQIRTTETESETLSDNEHGGAMNEFIDRRDSLDGSLFDREHHIIKHDDENGSDTELTLETIAKLKSSSHGISASNGDAHPLTLEAPVVVKLRLMDSESSSSSAPELVRNGTTPPTSNHDRSMSITPPLKALSPSVSSNGDQKSKED